jgi:chromosome segregation ATPase
MPAATSTPTTPAITHDWAAWISAEVNAQIGRELEAMEYVEVLRAINEAINGFIERIGDLEKAEAEGRTFKAQIDGPLTTLTDQLKAAAQNVADDNREILARITARLDASEAENKALREQAGALTGELKTAIERLDDVELELDQHEPAEPVSPFKRQEDAA